MEPFVLRAVRLVLCSALAISAGAAAWARQLRIDAASTWARARATALPERRERSRYAGSESCRACHGAAWHSWHGSHHRTMTQAAAPDTVVAPWAGELPGDVQLRWDGDAPVVVRPDAAPEPVVMLTGSHHMQLFWLHDRGSDTLRAFEYAWSIDDAAFVPNAATLLQPADADAVYTWNRVCIRCHAVAGAPGWHAGTGRVDSSVAELGIACESCHGPARAHVERHRDPVRRWLAHGARPDDVVQPAALGATAATEVCAQCHAISIDRDEAGWLRHGPDHAPGDPLASWTELVRHPARGGGETSSALAAALADDPGFLDDRFWSDGMVRVTGREANALLASPCAAAGDAAGERAISCLSCHTLHGGSPDDQLRAGMDGDDACTQCHAASSYARREHTHHDPAGSGARCLDCHMPRTTWGLLGAIRSHEIDVPDAAHTDATGRPLACNLCHLDRTLAWARSELARWRGREVPTPHTGDTPIAASLEGLLAGDAGVRGLWAWHLAWPPAIAVAGDGWQREPLVELLADPYPALRWVAWRSLVRLAGDAMSSVAPGTLPGPAHAARITAASGSVHDQFRAAPGSPVADPRGPTLLRSPSGALDRTRVDALLDRRDARTLRLAE
ncbi:MAG: hypothetical protein IPH07_11365 [Deltaproteobacteria bacterium]|nr:hypothetical protein [Deltaproteobacteria bacterium]